MLHGDLHLVDGTVQSVELGGIAQGHAPLSGSSLGGDVGGSFLLGIVALGQGRVDLVRAQRVGRLVLEVDVGRRANGFFQGIGAHQGGGAIVAVFVEHLFGNVNPCVFLV